MSRSLMIIVHVNMILVKSSPKPSIFPEPLQTLPQLKRPWCLQSPGPVLGPQIKDSQGKAISKNVAGFEKLKNLVLNIY